MVATRPWLRRVHCYDAACRRTMPAPTAVQLPGPESCAIRSALYAGGRWQPSWPRARRCCATTSPGCSHPRGCHCRSSAERWSACRRQAPPASTSHHSCGTPPWRVSDAAVPAARSAVKPTRASAIIVATERHQLVRVRLINGKSDISEKRPARFGAPSGNLAANRKKCVNFQCHTEGMPRPSRQLCWGEA